MRAEAVLKKGEGRAMKAGGLWIFDNEIDRIEGGFLNGDLIRVIDFNGYPMGTGYINTNSKITIRMMSKKNEQEIDRDFLRDRIKKSWDYRKCIFGGMISDLSCCRVIFGEADFLPGIIIDKFNDVLVVQSLTLGIDRMKLIIVELLIELLNEDGIHIRGVYERSDAKVREQEGMQRYKGFIGKEFDTKLEIVENDIRYIIDVENGQKTGYFLDQKLNRHAIRKLCSNAEVLDCFTYIGTFALNAAAAGAKSVLGLDASETAVMLARENARLNRLEDIAAFECGDVFDLLPTYEKEGRKFDLVILDPPALSKSKNSLKNAVKGYREINIRGLRLVKDGGFLATCSCSHFMTPELFSETISQAAKTAHKRLKQVEYRTQAPDHPILWDAGESYYLKFYIFQVCEER